MKQPISIKGQWNLLYSDYPKLYDRFSNCEDSEDQIFEFIKKDFDIKNKTILDLGAGTGRYSILFSLLADKVYSLEPSSEMRDILNQKVKVNNIKNLHLIDKPAQDFELPDNSIDIIFSSWVLSGIYNWHINTSKNELHKKKKELIAVVDKLKRILKDGGSIIVVETAPGQYGGELQSFIMGSKEDFSGNFTGWFADEFGFKSFRKNIDFNFDSTAEAAEIFGFIYGNKVREHILKKDIRNIKMEVCIMIKNIKK